MAQALNYCLPAPVIYLLFYFQNKAAILDSRYPNNHPECVQFDFIGPILVAAWEGTEFAQFL